MTMSEKLLIIQQCKQYHKKFHDLRNKNNYRCHQLHSTKEVGFGMNEQTNVRTFANERIITNILIIYDFFEQFRVIPCIFWPK